MASSYLLKMIDFRKGKKMNCKYCSTDTEGGAFCPKCGKAVENIVDFGFAEQPYEAESPSKSRSGKRYIWAVAGLVVVIGAVVLVTQLPHSSSAPKISTSASDSNNVEQSQSPSSVPSVTISSGWATGNNLVASTIDAALFENNFCMSEPVGADPMYYANAILESYNANTFRKCWNYSGAPTPSTPCPAELDIVADGEHNSGKRSLYYEDGFSVALLYGKNWTIEVSPNNNTESESQVVESCKPFVSGLAAKIGGSLTVLGQYQ
jgi:hypothetical protein